MRKWVTRGCLLVNVLLVAIGIISCYLSVPSSAEASFLPPPTFFVTAAAGFIFLLTTGFYAVWTTFVDNARPQKPLEARKSQFVFTKDGEIIEVVDEKRKRGGESLAE